MKFIKFKDKFKDFLIFSLKDILKQDPKFYRTRLNEWQKKGYLQKIIKKYYIFSDLEINEQVLFLIANKIYSHSYISLESALSYYGLIPESVYGITSVTSKHTYTFQTELGEFSYKKIKPEYMFGYNLFPYKNHNIKIANPEKTILDYLYINPEIKNKNDFFELRINKENFHKTVNITKIKKYLKTYKNKSFQKRVRLFIKFIENA